jgi:hypothetical protein
VIQNNRLPGRKARNRLGAGLLDGTIVLLTAALFLIAATGGIDVHLGDVQFRVRNWERPFALLVIALAARGWTLRGSADLSTYAATRGLLAILIAAGSVYAQYHVRVAGGLDSYGYVSTASLITSGRLTQPQPIAAVLPFDTALRAATPIGHVAGPDGTSVPRFPLGLPLVMALFTIFGPAGPFFVPLVMAYVAIFLAYLIARAPAPLAPIDHLGGLFAATLVAIDPVFVAHAIQPMSDVPATCWLLATIVAVLRAVNSVRPVAWTITAGVCAGMALLTRPVFLPAVLVMVLIVSKPYLAQLKLRPAGGRSLPADASSWRQADDLSLRSPDAASFRAVRTFAGIVLGFAVFQLALNTRLYGSPALSGYGTTSHMFELSFSRVAANVSSFGKWLTYSHTVLVWLVWPFSMTVLRRDRLAWQISAIAAAAATPYLFYMVFDEWQFLRFVLPSIALVLILFARAVTHPSSPFAKWRDKQVYPAVLFAVALALAARSHRFLEREAGIDKLARLEAKYVLVGDWFRQNTSERAVVLASLHSGSIRFYGNRQTVRWDEIPVTALTMTLRSLIASGYEPFLVLDVPSEPPLFHERFDGQPLNLEQVSRVQAANIYRFLSAY